MSRVPTPHTIVLIQVARTPAKEDSALPMSNAGARRTENTRHPLESGNQERNYRLASTLSITPYVCKRQCKCKCLCLSSSIRMRRYCQSRHLRVVFRSLTCEDKFTVSRLNNCCVLSSSRPKLIIRLVGT